MIIQNKYNVSVISFKLTDSSGEQIYNLPFNTNKKEYNKVDSECIVYLPDSFKNHFSNIEKIFFHLSTYEKREFESALLYQETAISTRDLPQDGLLKLNFSMNFPSEFKPYKLVGYRFSVSAKDVMNQKTDADENEGVFFDTVIPSEVINDGK